MNWFKKKTDKPYILRTLEPRFERHHAERKGNYIGSGILLEYNPDRVIRADLYRQDNTYLMVYEVNRTKKTEYLGDYVYETIDEMMGIGSLNDLARDILRRNGKFIYQLRESGMVE